MPTPTPKRKNCPRRTMTPCNPSLLFFPFSFFHRGSHPPSTSPCVLQPTPSPARSNSDHRLDLHIPGSTENSRSGHGRNLAESSRIQTNLDKPEHLRPEFPAQSSESEQYARRFPPNTAQTGVRRSPDPRRSPRHPPAVRSPTSSCPAARRARSGCPRRSMGRRGRSVRP